MSPVASVCLVALFVVVAAAAPRNAATARVSDGTCEFNIVDGGELYHFDLSSIALPANQGYNFTTDGQVGKTASFNFCNGARCPCLSRPSAICDCDLTNSQDFATLSTRHAVALPGSYGLGLELEFDDLNSGAIRHSNVFLMCDPNEHGIRLLYGNTRGDGHGQVSFTFTSKAGCGANLGPAPPPGPPPSSNSCAAYGCGQYVRGRPCQCDHSCSAYGNCCSDYSTVCSGNPSRLALEVFE
eukprot:m.486242 g.486242  ORF g.486242 m.486242 type:complete len:241 (-) comp24264_c0_seq1:136-858(-)